MPPSAPGEDDRERLELILHQTEEAMRGLADARASILQVTGEADAVGGMVKVVADGEGRLMSITLNPRVMRLDPEELGREATRAIQAAQDAAGLKAQEIIEGAQARAAALAPDPLDATFVRSRVERIARELE